MRSILDPTFRYVPSVQTDIRKTFARLRREQREAGSGRPSPQAANVLVIPSPRRVTGVLR